MNMMRPLMRQNYRIQALPQIPIANIPIHQRCIFEAVLFQHKPRPTLFDRRHITLIDPNARLAQRIAQRLRRRIDGVQQQRIIPRNRIAKPIGIPHHESSPPIRCALNLDRRCAPPHRCPRRKQPVHHPSRRIGLRRNNIRVRLARRRPPRRFRMNRECRRPRLCVPKRPQLCREPPPNRVGVHAHLNRQAVRSYIIRLLRRPALICSQLGILALLHQRLGVCPIRLPPQYHPRARREQLAVRPKRLYRFVYLN